MHRLYSQKETSEEKFGLTPMDHLQPEEHRFRSRRRPASSLNFRDVPVSPGVQTCKQWLISAHGNL